MTKKTAIVADLTWLTGLVLALVGFLAIHNLYLAVAGLIVFAIGVTIGATAIATRRVETRFVYVPVYTKSCSSDCSNYKEKTYCTCEACNGTGEVEEKEEEENKE